MEGDGPARRDSPRSSPLPPDLANGRPPSSPPGLWLPSGIPLGSNSPTNSQGPLVANSTGQGPSNSGRLHSPHPNGHHHHYATPFPVSSRPRSQSRPSDLADASRSLPGLLHDHHAGPALAGSDSSANGMHDGTGAGQPQAGTQPPATNATAATSGNDLGGVDEDDEDDPPPPSLTPAEVAASHGSGRAATPVRMHSGGGSTTVGDGHLPPRGFAPSSPRATHAGDSFFPASMLSALQLGDHGAGDLHSDIPYEMYPMAQRGSDSGTRGDSLSEEDRPLISSRRPGRGGSKGLSSRLFGTAAPSKSRNGTRGGPGLMPSDMLNPFSGRFSTSTRPYAEPADRVTSLSPASTTVQDGLGHEPPPVSGAGTDSNFLVAFLREFTRQSAGLSAQEAEAVAAFKAQQERDQADLWPSDDDLDAFLIQVYDYYCGHGIQSITFNFLYVVFLFIFTTCFSTFLLYCVNYRDLFSGKIQYLSEAIQFSNIRNMHVPYALLLAACFLLLLAVIASFVRQFGDLRRMSRYYDVILGLRETDLRAVEWDDVLERLLAAQPSPAERARRSGVPQGAGDWPVPEARDSGAIPIEPPSTRGTPLLQACDQTDLEGGPQTARHSVYAAPGTDAGHPLPGNPSGVGEPGIEAGQSPCFRPLDAFVVTNRILRRDNYLLGILAHGGLGRHGGLLVPNRGGFVLRATRGSRYMYFILESLLAFVLFEPRSRQVRGEVFEPLYHARVSKRLALWFRSAGVLLFLISPIALFFLLATWLFLYGQHIYSNPHLFGSRDFTARSRLALREFNEYGHLFSRRLDSAIPLAESYLSQFPTPYGSFILRFVTLITGSVAITLLALSLLGGDAVLKLEVSPGRTVLWYTGMASVAYAWARRQLATQTRSSSRGGDSFEGIGFSGLGISTLAGEDAGPRATDPARAMALVIEHTHYFPRSWRGRLHTVEVRDAFSTCISFVLWTSPGS
ncbi:hypothetical protein H696_03858 [Fonticula alba]|uniref:Autophagy-related protein 9 n=1 Tax=Fonticula alba TaxID=691883 RepID=A0A058Z587_FONAL|nr:hypothetical protein H696_03858 [Fonticula alba]KCV69429.1 hypothetical protein H696_03858 [Fonticula alba]|eukprot:XP_009495994.1 hypothetical protein H696_03858 [Fonticula alba]